jgi:hypothetical protein
MLLAGNSQAIAVVRVVAGRVRTTRPGPNFDAESTHGGKSVLDLARASNGDVA